MTKILPVIVAGVAGIGIGFAGAHLPCGSCETELAQASDAPTSYVLTPIGFQPERKDGHDARPQPGADEMREYMEAMRPTEDHQKLNAIVGIWDADVKYWMEGQEMTSTGSMTASWDMGGRFVKGEYVGTAMGMPFKGVMYWGFHKPLNRYEGIWIDSMGSGISMSTGKAENDGKRFVMMGEHVHPMTGEKMPVREVTTIVNDNRHTFETFNADTDEQIMKIVYTRAN